jgi:hypothetical protein
MTFSVLGVTRLVAVAALALAAHALPSAAQTINANNPAGIAEALQGLGYQARLEKDSVGDPVIRSSMEGVSYSIVFYGCESGSKCKYLNFSMGFDLTNGIESSRINDWNRNNIFGKAYLDEENDPFINISVTTVGGLGTENFADLVDWWRVVVSQFKTHINW